MFKTSLLLVFVIGAILLYREYTDLQKAPILGDKSQEQEISENNSGLVEEVLIKYNGQEISVDWVNANPENVSLLPNFEEKKPASRVYYEMGCRALINGGFYTKTNEPIGLFITSGEVISPFQQNQLLNGILSVTQFGTAKISREQGEEFLHAVQTGPILQENNQVIELDLIRDEPARRVVAAITGDNKIIFFVFAQASSSFGGPFLADLPQILEQIEKDENLNIADAINLDGGAASAFYAGDTFFSEASPVGSFWCAK